MKTLIVDNYDSFTYNIFQQVTEINKTEPLVLKNDDKNWSCNDFSRIDNIIISPGPGHPGIEKDFGICREVIEKSPVPVLGVCLGFQGMVWCYGGRVIHAEEAMHGRISSIYHTATDIFENIPVPFNAVRYHSLIVAPDLPADFLPIAWTDTGIIMGVKHKKRLLYGVQFHPESICTEYGYDIFRNFRNITLRARAKINSRFRCPDSGQVCSI